MKLQFWSIGKPHEAWIKDGVEEFTGRITRYSPLSWKIIPPVKNAGKMDADTLKKAEASVVMNMLDKDDYLVLLDEKGQMQTSTGLAGMLQQRANESTRQVVFLIGGAFGVDDTVKKRANYIWSMSKLVFPHMIVRLLLAEQVYRAYTILNNEKYHHL